MRERPWPLAQCGRQNFVEVTPSRSRPDRGTATVRSITRNQRGDVVQEGRTQTLVRGRLAEKPSDDDPSAVTDTN